MEIRGRRDPDFPRRIGYVDEVRHVGIQLHKGIPRTPWLPPFVLCVKQLYGSRPNERKARTAGEPIRAEVDKM